MKYEARPLPFEKDLEGISKKTIEIHHDKLYVGYVNKKNEIQEKLEQADLGSANQTYSELRALKDGETFAVNGVYLHEAYFDVLGGEGGMPAGELLAQIEKDYGSYDKWEARLKAYGLAARGWVVFCWDSIDKRTRFYTADSHNQGGIWGAIPLVVLDVYEHAYFMDYGSDRGSYINDFIKNLNWNSALAAFDKINKN